MTVCMYTYHIMAWQAAMMSHKKAGKTKIGEFTFTAGLLLFHNDFPPIFFFFLLIVHQLRYEHTYVNA